LTGRWTERSRRGQQLADARQNLGHGLAQVERTRCRHDALGRSQKQRIVQQIAQATDRVTDG
jgi:hypothetical protein